MAQMRRRVQFRLTASALRIYTLLIDDFVFGSLRVCGYRFQFIPPANKCTRPRSRNSSAAIRRHHHHASYRMRHLPIEDGVGCGRDKFSLTMKMRDEQQLLRSQF